MMFSMNFSCAQNTGYLIPPPWNVVLTVVYCFHSATTADKVKVYYSTSVQLLGITSVFNLRHVLS